MNKNPSVKETFKSRSSKAGGISLILIALMLAIIIVVNLILPKLPARIKSFDLSANKKYTISDVSKKIINSLKNEVNIIYIVESGNEGDGHLYIKNLIESYNISSPKINVKTVDPIVNPKFTSKYTDTDVKSGSIIVTCNGRVRVFTEDDLFDSQIDYYTGNRQFNAFQGENVITNAITYVTSDNLPKISFMTGHGEEDLDATFSSVLTNANYEIGTLKLAAEGKVPEDTDCVAIINPGLDLSEEDVRALNDYVSGGGKIFMASDEVDIEKYPNLVSFLKGYGIELVKGILVELDTEYCYSYNGMSINYMLLPHTDNHEITNDMTNYYVMFPQTQGFTISENLPDGVKTQSLLSTSEKAYSSINIEKKQSSEKEEGDIEVDGTFKLGAAVTYNEGKIVYYSTSKFMEPNVNQSVSGANSILFVKSFGWLCDTPDSVSIPAIQLSYDSLVINSHTATVFRTIIIVIIPALLILAGITVIVLRKKR